MIVFVYNADSGKANAAFDMAHKLLSPSTYQCSLCQLTHGVLSEKLAWKNFRQEMDQELQFLHRDEYEKRFSKKYSYPVVLRMAENENEVLFSSDQLKEIKDLENLILQIKTSTAAL